MQVITHHFINDGGLDALCLLSARSKWEENGPNAQLVQSMLGYTAFNLAHLAYLKPELLESVVSWLGSDEPRVFTPSVGVLCKLCRFKEARAGLSAAGAAQALEGFARRQIRMQRKGVDQRVVQRAAVAGKALAAAGGA